MSYNLSSEEAIIFCVSNPGQSVRDKNGTICRFENGVPQIINGDKWTTEARAFRSVDAPFTLEIPAGVEEGQEASTVLARLKAFFGR